MEESLELMLIVYCIYMPIMVYHYHNVLWIFFRISHRESNTIAHGGTRLRNNNTVFITVLFNLSLDM